jgi:hypothetical protein
MAWPSVDPLAAREKAVMTQEVAEQSRIIIDSHEEFHHSTLSRITAVTAMRAIAVAL